MMHAHRIPDPIYGTIRPPPWLMAIETSTPVRRMTLIRQLGLKAYIDFPGAIHTRFSHALGVMELAGRITDLLITRLATEGKPNSVANLRDNRNTIMAAGFLHDIGHGPFSHAVDFPLSKLSGKTHEELSTRIISEELKDLEHHGISIESVNRIITSRHKFPFVSSIVNGPLDADKLDYLLRDSHHVGLKYALDIENFIEGYTVLGGDKDLSKSELGLENTPEALTSAEIFLTIWKGMYDLVYHIENSRIAEKMLERAILAGCSTDNELRGIFQSPEKVSQLYDEKLLEILQGIRGFPQDTAAAILTKRGLFVKTYDKELSVEKFATISQGFLEAIRPAGASEASFSLSEKTCKAVNAEPNQIICDVVKSRVPNPIHVGEIDAQGDPIELKSKSSIIGAIKEKIRLKAYIHPSLQKKMEESVLSKTIEGLIASW
jgi:HD superfamily phosphohydrolase